MRRRKSPGPHLDQREVLDLLENRLDANARARFEEHLATPCSRCREAVRSAGALLEVMRRDRSEDVPESLHQIALEAFRSIPVAEREPGLVKRMARLLFDSSITPAGAVSRRAVGSSRLLRFSLGAGVLELECEHDTATSLTLRGRLEAAEPALHRLDIECGGENRTAWPDAEGCFAVEGVPRGRTRISVTGPGGRHRLPVLSF